MRIALYVPNDADAWTTALERALPQARIEPWTREAGADADYAVVWRPPPDVLPSLRRAKAIFNLGAGVDAIPGLGVLKDCAPLIRLDDAGMAEQMIEYVCHAALRCYRELDLYADQQRRAVWQPRPRAPKHPFAIGILGAGVLGAAVAEALARLRFTVRTWSRTRKELPGGESFAGMAELASFLSGTRFLVCLLPLTDETRNLLDRARLSLLPRGAWLVNVARGPIVVDADVLALLDEGHLAGAFLDVFDEEPLPREHPFWHHPRVVVTPHVSAVTLIEASAEQVADKIGRLEAGLPVGGVVDPVLGY